MMSPLTELALQGISSYIIKKPQAKLSDLSKGFYAQAILELMLMSYPDHQRAIKVFSLKMYF